MAPEESILDQIANLLNKGVPGDTLEAHLRKYDPEKFCDLGEFEVEDYRDPPFTKKFEGFVYSEPGEVLIPEQQVVSVLSIFVIIFFRYSDSKSARNSRKAQRYSAALLSFFSRHWRNIISSKTKISAIQRQQIKTKSGHYISTGINIETSLNFTRIQQ